MAKTMAKIIEQKYREDELNKILDHNLFKKSSMYTAIYYLELDKHIVFIDGFSYVLNHKNKIKIRILEKANQLKAEQSFWFSTAISLEELLKILPSKYINTFIFNIEHFV